MINNTIFWHPAALYCSIIPMRKLEDEEWLFDMAFLADLTGELGDMNFDLQGRNKCIVAMTSTVSSYKCKFELMMQTVFLITFLICRTIWK
jgi:hypothetical protein